VLSFILIGYLIIGIIAGFWAFFEKLDEENNLNILLSSFFGIFWLFIIVFIILFNKLEAENDKRKKNKYNWS
jgi:hypothetical protein